MKARRVQSTWIHGLVVAYNTLADPVADQQDARAKRAHDISERSPSCFIMWTRNPRRQSNEFVLLIYPDALSMPHMQETASNFVAEAE